MSRNGGLGNGAIWGDVHIEMDLTQRAIDEIKGKTLRVMTSPDYEDRGRDNDGTARIEGGKLIIDIKKGSGVPINFYVSFSDLSLDNSFLLVAELSNAQLGFVPRHNSDNIIELMRCVDGKGEWVVAPSQGWEYYPMPLCSS